MTGVGDFILRESLDVIYGYVFSDGSFKIEACLNDGKNSVNLNLLRSHSGSIYPYGNTYVNYIEAHEESYTNKLGQNCCISKGDSLSISYVSPNGKTFIELQSWLSSKGEGSKKLNAEFGKALADRIDFEALCLKNDAPREIIEKPRGAEDNMDTQQKIKNFEASPVFSAAKEFQDFFTENFYGFCFDGTYGMKGYADIDAELQRFSDKYSLQYAKQKTEGNEFSQMLRSMIMGHGNMWGRLKQGIFSTIIYLKPPSIPALFTMRP